MDDDFGLLEEFKKFCDGRRNPVDASSNAAIIGLNEIAITTTKTEDVSTLATDGLKPGHVAVIGYEPGGTTFLAHLDDKTDVEASVYRLHLKLFELEQQTRKKQTYDVDIIGGVEEYKRVKDAFKNIKGFKHALVMDVKEQKYKTEAVSIDAKNGNVNPKPAQKYRTPVPEKTYNSVIPADVVYSPRNESQIRNVSHKS